MKMHVQFPNVSGIAIAMLLYILLPVNVGAQTAPGPPNILWLTMEDISPDLGAYGDTFAHTPNLDEFAKKSLRYDMAWSNIPVCSPARTAIITGMYPASFGGHNHRSEVGLPQDFQMYPRLLQEKGYYVTNNSKEDYNVVHAGGDRNIWNESSGEAHYHKRPHKETPFFAIFNNTDSHGSSIRQRTDLPFHNPDSVPLPPFHPDTPGVRRDWAQYYHSITVMDEWFGRKIQEARDDGLMDNTIIFVYGDHGGGMPTYKQLAYNRGLQVPMFIYIPDKYLHLAPEGYEPGGSTNQPVGFVDLAPTLLSLIGTEPPEWMQGKAFMGVYKEEPQKYLYGARGRMDERIDMVRSVRDDRYIYIRNYMPHLMHGYFSEYMYTFVSTNEWRDLYFAGELISPQTMAWEPKPPEELYDLAADPHEVRNLAESPDHQVVLDRMRAVHRDHVIRIRDVQFLPEAEMHRRAKYSSAPIWMVEDRQAVSIYEMAQDTGKYPVERIFTMAETAAGYSLSAIPTLMAGLRDDDPAIRYWAALGILIRGNRTLKATGTSLREALDDPNPSVRVVVNQILATHGNPEERRQAKESLIELAQPDEMGVYVAIEALNALNNLDGFPESDKTAILRNETEDPDAGWRGANEYIIRLMPGYSR